MKRLRITLQFNKNKTEELKLYLKLQQCSNPSAYIKDILKGLTPLSTLYDDVDNNKR